MRGSHRFIIWIFGLSLICCLSIRSTAASEAQQILAPTGKLRVAFIAGPLYASKNSATGELKGVATDLGAALAGRIAVPFQPVVYPNPAAIVLAAKSGEWDVALIGMNAERAAAIDFSAPYMEVEQGYLVRAGIPITNAADVDRPGIRVAVLQKAGVDVYLSGTLKQATLVRVKTLSEFGDLLQSGQADVFAATKTFLFGRAANWPGSRVLDGRILVEPIGMGVPKGRNAIATAYVGKFIEEAKATGLVKSAIQRAGLRGVTVAPPQ